MCLAFLVFGCQPPQPLMLLAFNRDEYFQRPTQPLHKWSTGSGLLAGRDLDAGGTWLGVNADSGRVAFLTNLRTRDSYIPSSHSHTHASRGELPTGFLSGNESPLEFAQSLDLEQYNGFNLVVGDLRGGARDGAFVYTNNAAKWVQVVKGGAAVVVAPGDSAGAAANGRATDSGPGSAEALEGSQHCCGGSVQVLELGRVYGLSNGLLMEWPKVVSGISLMEGLLSSVCSGSSVPWDRIFLELLGDSTRLVPPAEPVALAHSPEAFAPNGNGAISGLGEDGGEQRPGWGEAAPCGVASGAQGAAHGGDRDEEAPSGVAGGAEGGAAGVTAVATASSAEGDELPEKYDAEGFSRNLEHLTSGRFVKAVDTPYGMYGTRSQTVVVVWHDGAAEARERHRHEDGVWRWSVVPFRMELGGDGGGGGGGGGGSGVASGC